MPENRIKNKMYKGVIFDLDGTIADTIGDITNALNLMRQSYNLGKTNKDEVLKHINFGAINVIAGVLPENFRDEKTLKEALVRYSQFYSENIVETTYAYQGIREIFQILYDDGYKICVLSNKQDKLTKAIVKTLFPEKYFVEILGASEQFPHKPNPASSLYLAEKMQLPCGEIIFAGDSNIDIETAKNAGMFAVGVSWGYRSREILEQAGAMLILDKPEDLICFLK